MSQSKSSYGRGALHEHKGVGNHRHQGGFLPHHHDNVLHLGDVKALSPAQEADYADETARIRVSVAKPENQKPHKFEAAEWTHTNGHPRCIHCGAEERTDGMCEGDMVPTGDDARSPSRPRDQKGDASGHEFHGNRYTGGIGGSGKLPFNVHGDQYFRALSPKGQAFVKASCVKFRITPEKIAKEIQSRLTLPDGTPNKALLADGAKWYPMAHDLAERTAASTQDMEHPVTTDQVAAAMARLSPQTPWETNAEVATRLAQWVAAGKADGLDSDKAALAFKAEWHANGWGGESKTNPGTMNKLAMMNNLVADGIDVLDGRKTIEESLTSPKQRSFANNIMLPHETDDVTVDVMMQKSISFSNDPPPLPKDPDAAEEAGLPRDKTIANFFGAKSVEAAAGPGYVTVAAGTRMAAEALGVPPDTVQAAYWIAVQDQTPTNWPRSTGATMTQMKTPNVIALLGHPFIGTAGYKFVGFAAKEGPLDDESAFPLDVDYGDMALDPIETMTDAEYEAAVEEGKSAPTGEMKYSEDEPRDENGEWTTGGGGSIGSVEGGGRITTIDEAVRLLGQGKGIMFERPDQAVTLLHELSRIAKEAKAAGTKAPTYDLCKVSVVNTNLFCSENVGIPRSAMPQLIGKPLPGSPADSLPKSARGEVDLGPAFRDYLTAQGNLIIDTDEFASHLRASQTEMDGTKVGGMMEAMEAGTLPPGRIFISDDNYVIDGHHRWAATVGESLGTQKEMSISVARINMKILPALAAANSFAVAMGIPQSGITKAFFDALDLKLFEVPDVKGDASGLIKWFEDGADGQIDWGSPGDFDDCVRIASKHMDEDQAKGFCQLRHMGATGSPAGHAPGEDEK